LKARWKAALCCCLGFAVLAGLLEIALGWESGGQGAVAAVAFSHPSGFYDEDFFLELGDDGDPIYYTLDATDPDVNSTPYTGPILIRDASPNENVYSAITDTSAFYDTDLLKQNGLEKKIKYVTPEAPVDKATVVRAVRIDAYGNRGPISTAVYFVGFGNKKGYAGLNIMAITTAPANLFDEKEGIYVLGEAFNETIQDGIIPYRDEYVFKWPANYKQRGREWEREADVQCFDPTGNLIFAGPCGIRIQGRATRANMPKGLNIYARKEYGCASFDTGGLFSRAYKLNRLNLFNGSDDLMLRDDLVNEMIGDIDVTRRECAPCALFLDGEYWGVYWLATRLKADYLNQIYGVKKDNIIEIKSGLVEIGRDEDEEQYQAMVSCIADEDMRLPENFDRACELIDLQSFIDYYAVEIYVANTDWPTNNYALWRSRRKVSDDWSDGRWRWMLYDLDISMDAKDAEKDNLKYAISHDALFESLMCNDDVRDMFTQKLLQLARETFAPERTDAFIDSYETKMAEAIEKEYQRFYGEYDMDKRFYAGCEKIRAFFRQRQAYIIKTYGGEEQ